MAEEQKNMTVDTVGAPLAGISPRLLKTLLQDKSTGRNIVWATNNYEHLGEGYDSSYEILPELISGVNKDLIQPRVLKAAEEQQSRTRKHAEVFTPSWICAKMCSALDEDWYAQEGKTWQDYVDSRRLEITCGEAPFLVSRYDTATGERIPLERRVGLLDRKLRIVGYNTQTEEDWLKWAFRALQSTYGYEYQGDNLLIARINVVLTFADYLMERWAREATEGELLKAANIAAWNLWQMDGLKGICPVGAIGEVFFQYTLFGEEPPMGEEPTLCKLRDWRSKVSVFYADLARKGTKGMKFDYAIGNPPYQDETLGENKGYAPPVYHLFLEEAYKVADKVEMIHPARFLFNAGSTPKDWNQKMLKDEHFKVLYYRQDASSVFSNTDIKGGIVISYRDKKQLFNAVQIFTPFEELNTILKKVSPNADEEHSLMSIIYIQNRFNLDALYCDYPEYKEVIGSDGRDSRFEKNIFTKIPIFRENGDTSGIKTLGIFNNKRSWRYIPRKYVDFVHENLDKYKVVLPVANGSGEFGQSLSTPVLECPYEAYTRSFIGIGAFETKCEGEAALKYIKTKFARAMLSVLKVTQMNNKDVWLYVPIQDFSTDSDIDWSVSVAGVDAQLYKKYDLSPDEIAFIESHVKEME